jgi:thiamine biosynthesis protein ThiS
MQMEVTVNGQRKEFPSPLTVSQMLLELGVNPRSVVVEKNLRIVNRDDMERESVAQGDTIEIIRLVGGG